MKPSRISCSEWGENTAYYDVLNLLQIQIEAFDYDPTQFGAIVPELGKKQTPKVGVCVRQERFLLTDNGG